MVKRVFYIHTFCALGLKTDSRLGNPEMIRRLILAEPKAMLHSAGRMHIIFFARRSENLGCIQDERVLIRIQWQAGNCLNFRLMTLRIGLCMIWILIVRRRESLWCRGALWARREGSRSKKKRGDFHIAEKYTEIISID